MFSRAYYFINQQFRIPKMALQKRAELPVHLGKTGNEIIDVVTTNPILINRPVVVTLCRTSETVLTFSTLPNMGLHEKGW
tara:strand:- start:448 stop:687 length:240 start_codon:yes stop_codon:yes gene_type:complete